MRNIGKSMEVHVNFIVNIGIVKTTYAKFGTIKGKHHFVAKVIFDLFIFVCVHNPSHLTNVPPKYKDH